jgi:hypothetical protein
VIGRHNGFAPSDPVYVGYRYDHHEVK